MLHNVLRAYAHSGLKGSYRVPLMLADHLPSLQRVPIQIADWPTLYMDLRLGDALRWFTGSPWPSSPRCPDEQAVIRRLVQPGMTVYDVGANVGLYTALCSRLVGRTGRIYSFEPNPALRSNLQRSIAEMGNVTFFPVALSERTGEAVFYVPDDHLCASLRNWTGRPVHELRVTTVRLDDLIEREHLPPPAFLKVDAEDAEVAIFQGAERLLREHRPIVLFEDMKEYGHHFAPTRLLQSWGYTVEQVNPDGTLGAITNDACNLVARYQ